MAKRDYYDVLGVGRNADPATIKSAYRKLAKQYHPDRNAGDSSAEARFREATEAYDVLRDDQKRAAYDQFGHSAFDGNGRAGGGFAGGFDSAGFSAFGDINDIFNAFFGGEARSSGRQRGSQASRGEDLRYDIEISLEEAFSGAARNIAIATAVACATCNNSGATPGTKPDTCDTCGGAGQVRRQQGFFSVLRTCPACRGEGEVITSPCKKCSGTGRVEKNKSLTIKIPAGVDSGTQMTVAGEGHAGIRGGKAGNLYIIIHVSDHALFIRDGNNLLLQVPVPMTKAALGGEIDIPTLDGKLARVSIEPGTQSDHTLRLRGKGMPQLQASGAGDMLVDIQVEVPSRLTAKQKQLLHEFATASDAHNPQVDEFHNRIKQFFQRK